MHRSRQLIPLPAALLAATAWTAHDATAQQRDVVSTQIEVSSREASLRLEFADGGRLALGFADGVVLLDGEALGTYRPGGDAERAWRGLLADAMSLSDGTLAGELEQWSPGAELDGDALELLQRVDAALESGLAGHAQSPGSAQGDAPDQAAPAPAAPDQAATAPRTPDQAATAPSTRPAAPPAPASPDDLARMRDEIRDEVRAELRREFERVASERESSRGYSAPRALRAAGDVLGTVFTYLVAGALALLLLRFAGPRLDAVAREIGRRPGRAAVVGFAGGFLLLPTFVIGAVVLAVSLLGIPLLLAWLPLFPLAVGVAAFAGYVGVSRHVGRWVLDQDWPWLDRVDRHRDAHVVLTGLAALMLPFAAGGALGALPLIGWVGGLIELLGTIVGVAALCVGFGAVVVTRGGRHSTRWPGSVDDELETAAEWSSMGDWNAAPADTDDTASADDPTPATGEER